MNSERPNDGIDLPPERAIQRQKITSTMNELLARSPVG